MSISTREEYEAALTLIDDLFDTELGEPEYNQLIELVSQVERYEKEHFPIPPPSFLSRFRFWWECHRHWWQRR